MAHPLFQTNIQFLQFFTETFFFLPGCMGKPAAFTGCKCKILFDCHTRRSSTHRILIKTADLFCACMLWHKCDIPAIQLDRSCICEEVTTDCIEKC